MAFKPVNHLETCLVAATHNPASRSDFYRALIATDLLIISENPGPAMEGEAVPRGKMQVKIQLVEVAGKPHVPIFSSKQRISAIVKTEVPFIAMNGRALFSMVRGADVVMNPGAEYGKVFTAAEIESILDETIFAATDPQIAAGKKVLLSQPAEYPTHIAEAMRGFFPKFAEVTRAYLAQADFQQSGQPPHILIGVETTGNWQELLSQAAAVAQTIVRAGDVIDLIQMNERPDDGVSAYFRLTMPIYERAV
jgi:SseB protein C-terminal domain/SseB protein N-terminal domain